LCFCDFFFAFVLYTQDEVVASWTIAYTSVASVQSTAESVVATETASE